MSLISFFFFQDQEDCIGEYSFIPFLVIAMERCSCLLKKVVVDGLLFGC